jgi:hypothetical protein
MLHGLTYLAAVQVIAVTIRLVVVYLHCLVTEDASDHVRVCQTARQLIPDSTIR